MRRAEIIHKQKYISKKYFVITAKSLFALILMYYDVRNYKKEKYFLNNPSLAMHKGIIDLVSLWKVNLEMFSKVSLLHTSS